MASHPLSGSYPVPTLLSQSPRLRAPAPGLRDLKDLLTDKDRKEQIVGIAEAIIFEWERDDAGPGPIDYLVDAVRAEPAEDPRVKLAFRGELADLADLAEGTLRDRSTPPIGFTVTDPAAWTRHWLPLTASDRRKTREKFGRLERDLKLNAMELGRLLLAVRDDQEAYSLLMKSNLAGALALGRPFGALTLEESRQLVGDIGCLYSLIVANLRTAFLRRLDRAPMTDNFRYECAHQYMARTLTTTLAEPAVDIQAVLAVTDGPAALADLPTYLAGTCLNDPQLISMIELISRKCFGLGSGRLGYDHGMARARARLHGLVAPLAATKQEQLRADKLGRRSFVEERLGVSAAHGTVIIAKSLLDARAAIRLCVDCIVEGKPRPAPTELTFDLNPEGISRRALKHTTGLLRCTIKPDRQSEGLADRQLDDKAGWKMVEKALIKFEAERPQTAIDALSINPLIWFD